MKTKFKKKGKKICYNKVSKGQVKTIADILELRKTKIPTSTVLKEKENTLKSNQEAKDHPKY